MTKFQENVWSAVVGSIVSTVLIGGLALFTGAWSGKESAADHRSDVQALRSDIRRVLDVVCVDHPSAPQCKP
jgi:hypothetical protein